MYMYSRRVGCVQVSSRGSHDIDVATKVFTKGKDALALKASQIANTHLDLGEYQQYRLWVPSVQVNRLTSVLPVLIGPPGHVVALLPLSTTNMVPLT
jgi:coenzyme F420-reducing hydrogenase delta subunit